MHNVESHIPVIGTAIVNGVHWLERQIRSIDFPVENYLVINNNGRGEITRELDQLMAMPHRWIGRKHVVHMPANIGCSGAWNLIIKCNMLASYWCIVGHDVAFYPGFLAQAHDAAQDETVGLVHAVAGDHGLGSWSFFMMRDWVVRQHGLFDENFYPAYAEDLDYVMRLAHCNVRRVFMEKPYMHGDGRDEDYGKTGSQTWRTEPELKDKIDHARWLNENHYMTPKWGAAWRWIDPHHRPWNHAHNTTATWSWDLDFVRSKHLGF